MPPFPNTLVVVEVTGNDITKALENGIRGVEKSDDLPGSFLQVSGLSFTYDSSKPEGSRVLKSRLAGNRSTRWRLIKWLRMISWQSEGTDINLCKRRMSSIAD